MQAIRTINQDQEARGKIKDKTMDDQVVPQKVSLEPFPPINKSSPSDMDLPKMREEVLSILEKPF